MRGGAADAPSPAKQRAKARSKGKAKANARIAVPLVADRVLVITAFTILLFLGLAGRLFYIQVLKHDEYVRLADRLRDKDILLPARRGVLLDRAGNVLVRNEPACDIALDPNPWYVQPNPKAGDTPEARKQRAIEGLQKYLHDVNVASLVEKRGLTKTSSGRYRTIEIQKQVSEGTGLLIKKANLPGVAVFTTARRVAIDGELASHVIGFTGRDGDGLAGLEHSLDEMLTGEAGVISAEFDSRNRPIPGTIRDERAPQHGRDIVLTIDSDLQEIVQEALEKGYRTSKAASATAVVLDPTNGDILALANYPNYNVNARTGTPLDARMNRAVAAPFEPGSTLKAITIAAALEDRKISADHHFYCKGAWTIGKKTIHCHNGEVHKDETVTDVVRNSCNVATALCAFDLGKDRLYDYLLDFGFGQKTGSGLPGEGKGILASPDRWSQIQTANIAFGQGISVTALQLTGAYGAIANEGMWMRPRIVRGFRDGSGGIHAAKVEEGRRILSAETARTMMKMLQTVVENGTGTQARLNGYTSAGKTGTAQIAERGAYRGKHLASFIGVAPVKKPQFVILVAITDPKGAYYGGTVSGPVFREIAERALVARRVPRDRPYDPKKDKRRVATSRD
jgi:cell division protein FtsI/penicillin-binding protein 2